MKNNVEEQALFVPENASLSDSEGNLPNWLQDLSDNVRRNRPRSWKLSLGSTLDGPSSVASPPVGELQALVDDLSLDEEVFVPRRDSSARHGRRSVLAGSRSAGCSPCKSQVDVQGNLGLCNVKMGGPQSLEESWSSLSFFEKKHKGRLTKTLEENKYCSSPETSCEPLSDVNVSETNAVTNVVDDKAEVDFIIPELPSGRNLVLNIMSTWGDRHYLGLNGIEVFSSSGEPALIAKVSFPDDGSCNDCRNVGEEIHDVAETQKPGNLRQWPQKPANHLNF